MIAIIKDENQLLKGASQYALYVNDTLKVEFEHIQEPEDLAQLLRDAADQIDLSNNITPSHLKLVPKEKPKLTMMERLNGIQHHLEKKEMNY